MITFFICLGLIIILVGAWNIFHISPKENNPIPSDYWVKADSFEHPSWCADDEHDLTVRNPKYNKH
jgi:hypothetical protein